MFVNQLYCNLVWVKEDPGVISFQRCYQAMKGLIVMNAIVSVLLMCGVVLCYDERRT